MKPSSLSDIPPPSLSARLPLAETCRAGKAACHRACPRCAWLGSFIVRAPCANVPKIGRTPMNRLLPTTLVGSYAQPDWLIDREKLAGRFPPRVRAKELWRVAPEFLDSRAGRRDPARDPRAGARRPRHHHRRRDAARKLFQPLRDRARRRRHRQSRHGARPLRPSQPGAARHRQGAAQASRGGARRAVPARATPTA